MQVYKTKPVIRGEVYKNGTKSGVTSERLIHEREASYIKKRTNATI